MTQSEHTKGGKKRILGITGGVGSGKSMVLDYLRENRGAHVIFSDRVAAGMQKPGGACYEPMLELFGEEYLLPDGSFDRSAIAKKVFEDPVLLEKLNGIVHPMVRAAVTEETARFPDRLTVVESALLLEAGYRDFCDEVWYVFADEAVRSHRLKRDRQYSDERIKAVMASQKDEAFYRESCDLVIVNNGEPADAFRQIDKGLEEHGFMYDRERKQR